MISAGVGPWGHPDTDVIPVSIAKERKIVPVTVNSVIRGNIVVRLLTFGFLVVQIVNPE